MRTFVVQKHASPNGHETTKTQWSHRDNENSRCEHHCFRIRSTAHTANRGIAAHGTQWSIHIHIHHHLIVLLWPAFHSATISRPNDDDDEKHFTEYDIVAKSYYDSITFPWTVFDFKLPYHISGLIMTRSEVNINQKHLLFPFIDRLRSIA